VITAESQEVKLPRLLVSDARAFHTSRAYSNSRRFEEVLTSPVPKSEGPGAPSSWLEKITGTEAARPAPFIHPEHTPTAGGSRRCLHPRSPKARDRGHPHHGWKRSTGRRPHAPRLSYIPSILQQLTVRGGAYIPGPQKRGTGGTLILVGKDQRDRGRTPRAFHTSRAYFNSRRLEEVLTSPVPKSEGPGAPSSWLEKINGTEAARPVKSCPDTRLDFETRSSDFSASSTIKFGSVLH
jgi:hypothetical protein